MEPRIEILPGKNLIGKHRRMSFSDDRTFELWQSFMPRRKEIQNTIGTELYSVEVYAPSFFDPFDPDAEFEKWAAVAVAEVQAVPKEMEVIIVPAGRYAVFVHKGPASTGPKTYEHIFGTWLPGSSYQVDDRPHFAIMGQKYKHDNIDSEEELWIPVKPK
jgi:AraC family transcriptional regulator